MAGTRSSGSGAYECGIQKNKLDYEEADLKEGGLEDSKLQELEWWRDSHDYHNGRQLANGTVGVEGKKKVEGKHEVSVQTERAVVSK
ncbi:hypothetical protein NDU88_002489 [Pleurodeles waltl]|uniref:Uncharacterized protein n=1 Tax=Pleurodeles waltl TaxID=8319 RepID=A0AAV7VZU4_PLEWA|nr:hypothetical protein NDU88_002489 [Pleurodeles waltl]